MDINLIQETIEDDLPNLNSISDLEDVRIKYLGRKGLVAQLTSVIPTLAIQERGVFGKKVNALKNKITTLIQEKEKSLKVQVDSSQTSDLDIGMPGIARGLGTRHPITQIIDEACAIFTRMGFSVVAGPEIETEYNNFTGLNIPLEHPSRDAFDTFYLKSLSLIHI